MVALGFVFRQKFGDDWDMQVRREGGREGGLNKNSKQKQKHTQKHPSSSIIMKTHERIINLIQTFPTDKDHNGSPPRWEGGGDQLTHACEHAPSLAELALMMRWVKFTARCNWWSRKTASKSLISLRARSSSPVCHKERTRRTNPRKERMDGQRYMKHKRHMRSYIMRSIDGRERKGVGSL